MADDGGGLAHLHAGGARAGEERRRERGAPDAEPPRRGQARLGHDVAVDPADGTEWGEGGRVQQGAHTERLQREDASREEPLAAGFVGREGAALQEEDVEPAPGGGDRHRQAGGAAADDDEVVQTGHYRPSPLPSPRPAGRGG